MRTLLLLLFILCTAHIGQAQSLQTIKGKVQDAEIQFPIIGANVGLYKSDSLVTGTKTDVDGFFKIENIRPGKYELRLSYLGYKNKTLPSIEVTTGKETQLNIALQTNRNTIKEVTITTNKAEVNNEMAIVSARTFDPNEATRYAASRDDIARMATNFAGVRGSDDSRNDIVIRGNTPNGIIWRIEDLDVQNPNHFASFGSTGGPVNIVNNKLLGRSDFITSAFPADYGNGVSGVFDLRMRNGNRDKHEFTTQVGILGLEGTAEGPINRKKGSSYTLSYRYATLDLMNRLGINFGTAGNPSYQDVNFKMHFPLNKTMQINVFGLGGISDIAILDNGDDSTKWTFGRAGRDIHFGSRFALVGANFMHTINKNTFHKLTIGYNRNMQYNRYDTITPGTDLRGATYRNKFDNSKLMLHYHMTKRFKNNLVFKTGVNLTHYNFDMVDSNYYPAQDIWYNEAEFKGSTQMLQAYTSWKYSPSEKVQLNMGVHYINFLLNNSQALEPRIGLLYKVNEKLNWNLGYGLHSNIQQLFIYFLQKDDFGGYPYNYNINVGFNRSHHLVTGFDYLVSKSMRIKTEVYAQYLFNLPTEIRSSAYTPLNQGASFNFIFPQELENDGIGYNAGLDLTVEQFFNKDFYYLITGSLFTSKY